MKREQIPKRSDHQQQATQIIQGYPAHWHASRRDKDKAGCQPGNGRRQHTESSATDAMLKSVGVPSMRMQEPLPSSESKIASARRE
jgi:hypothetical protein